MEKSKSSEEEAGGTRVARSAGTAIPYPPRPRGREPSSAPSFDPYHAKALRSAHHTHLTAYERHRQYIKDYVLHYGNGHVTQTVLPSKTDSDVLREHHQFLRDECEREEELSWEARLAKSYYDKLFKEYCLADMTRYKSGKLGLRWRTAKEVCDGRGQFTCGNKHCGSPEDLHSFEVNFKYVEDGVGKEALVKLRLCPPCGEKLNYKANRAREKEERKAQRMAEKEERCRKRHEKKMKRLDRKRAEHIRRGRDGRAAADGDDSKSTLKRRREESEEEEREIRVRDVQGAKEEEERIGEDARGDEEGHRSKRQRVRNEFEEQYADLLM